MLVYRVPERVLNTLQLCSFIAPLCIWHDNSFVVGPLHTPEYLNVLNLPKHIVEQLITILKNKINQNKGFLLQNSYQNLLQHLTETDFHANIDNTKKGLKKMDQRRHLDSKQIFPALYKEVLI